MMMTTMMMMMMCRIREAGVMCPSVGLGSTPTASQPSPLMNNITELHPGNYVFYGLTLYLNCVFGLVLGYSGSIVHTVVLIILV